MVDDANASEAIERLENVVLNIAITGAAGTGKSSFVNALRVVEGTDEGAANTGETRTTTKCEMYPHPTMPNVRIWDLPGIGTPDFKAETYLKVFIIVIGNRVSEHDITLAKEIQKNNKNYYFVRSKIDQDITNAARKNVTEANTLRNIRESSEQSLSKLLFQPTPVFLISSVYLEKYDFPNFQNVLEKDLPQHKRNALVLSLPVYSLDCLEKKYNTLKSTVWALAAASGGIAAVPVPGLSPACDVAIVLSFFTKCYHSFGLDDKSLKKLGERVDKPILEMVRESALIRAIADKTFLSTKMAARLGAAGIVEGICSLVPVAGNVAAAGVSYVTTRLVLLEGLNELYKVAKQVIEIAGLQ